MRWRRAVSIVKNPRRRFRCVADLAKRAEAERRKRSIQVPLSSPPFSIELRILSLSSFLPNFFFGL
ncbi:unnamed protein product [Linum tenue]|uniref:Calcium-transporting P-type ATPase N-terminal autoinhibitory domain-containing protein n=1 Tax=Linum tenue TaxID=586396 RepID=A0AAV0L8K6_9ROSI|nr:unnamed protein product [Linum tenue]